MIIETPKVDLSQGDKVKFVGRDCPLDFRGYFVPTVPALAIARFRIRISL
jgi:hypothetical protein